MPLVMDTVTISRHAWDVLSAGAGHEQSQTEWLFGRLAAKAAVLVLWHARHGERLFPADIVIERDGHGRPVARPRGPEGLEPFPTISLAHTEDVAAGLAAVAPHAGIDVERIRPRDAGFERVAFDDDERRLLDRLGPDRDEWLARFWCAKIGRASCRERVEMAGVGGAEDGIRDWSVTGVQTCALPICSPTPKMSPPVWPPWRPTPGSTWSASGRATRGSSASPSTTTSGGFWTASGPTATNGSRASGARRSEERRVGKEWRWRGWAEQKTAYEIGQ